MRDTPTSLLDRIETPARSSGHLALGAGVLSWSPAAIRFDATDLRQHSSFTWDPAEQATVQLSRWEQPLTGWRRRLPWRRKPQHVVHAELRVARQRLALSAVAPTAEHLAEVASMERPMGLVVPWDVLCDLLSHAKSMGATLARYQPGLGPSALPEEETPPPPTLAVPRSKERYPSPLGAFLLAALALVLTLIYSVFSTLYANTFAAFLGHILALTPLLLILFFAVLRVRGRAAGLVGLALGLGFLPLGMPFYFGNAAPAVHAVWGHDPEPITVAEISALPRQQVFPLTAATVDLSLRRRTSRTTTDDDGKTSTRHYLIAPLRGPQDPAIATVHAWVACAATDRGLLGSCEKKWSGYIDGAIRLRSVDEDVWEELRRDAPIDSAPGAPFVEVVPDLADTLEGRRRLVLILTLVAAVVLLIFTLAWRTPLRRARQDEMWVQKNRRYPRGRVSSRGRGKPVARAVGKGHQRQHHGHLDEDPDHRGKGCARREAKEADGDGHGELEEVRSADHRSRGGDRVGQLEHFGRRVGHAEDAVALDEQGHGDEGDDQGFGDDGLGLEAEEEHHREEEAHD